MDQLFREVLVSAQATRPVEVVLDLDATDNPAPERQEGQFVDGFYGGYCYLPLNILCGEHLPEARLRKANRGASGGWMRKPSTSRREAIPSLA